MFAPAPRVELPGGAARCEDGLTATSHNFCLEGSGFRLRQTSASSAEQLGELQRIQHCHVGALALEWRHRVRGVTEQPETTVAYALEWSLSQ